MKSIVFVLALVNSSLAHAQGPATCENFSGTYRMTCEMPEASVIDKTTESVAKALVTGQQVEIVQAGCRSIATSGHAATIGGLNHQSLAIPVAEHGNADVSFVYSTSWQANNTALKSEMVGMIQLAAQEAFPFWALSQLRRAAPDRLESTVAVKAGTVDTTVICTYQR